MTNNFADDLINQLDQALKTLIPGNCVAKRESPALNIDEPVLADSARAHAAGLMRINHTGEVCAQALYQGQALTAKLDQVRDNMTLAAEEEIDHLSWCEERLTELDSRTSILNPAWYSLSFGLGAIAGLAGDKWSLGFVAETENQVCEHLQEHLTTLPPEDEKSQAILEQMIIDEGHHAAMATSAGAADLPLPFKSGMKVLSKIMKKAAYRI